MQSKAAVIRSNEERKTGKGFEEEEMLEWNAMDPILLDRCKYEIFFRFHSRLFLFVRKRRGGR